MFVGSLHESERVLQREEQNENKKVAKSCLKRGGGGGGGGGGGVCDTSQRWRLVEFSKFKKFICLIFLDLSQRNLFVSNNDYERKNNK